MLGSGPRGADPGGWTQVVHSILLMLLMLLPGGRDPGGWTQGAGRVRTRGGWMGLDLGGWTQGAGPRWYTQCYFSNFLLALGSGPRGPDLGDWTQGAGRVRTRGAGPRGLDPGGTLNVTPLTPGPSPSHLRGTYTTNFNVKDYIRHIRVVGKQPAHRRHQTHSHRRIPRPRPDTRAEGPHSSCCLYELQENQRQDCKIQEVRRVAFLCVHY